MAINFNRFTEKPAVSDGAWGTEMQKLGLGAGSCPELWNDENPEAVASVATSYIEAGSDIIISNTFGANSFVLAGHNCGDRAAELAEKGAAISRRAADASGRNVLVFASMGPTGKIVMMGEVEPEDIYKSFSEQAKALEAGGADAVVVETMTEIDEVELAARAIKDNTDLPIVLSLTYDSGPDKTSTMMGVSPADVVNKFADIADAFGANCGLGPENYIKVVELYRQETAKPIWIKANAGLPQVVNGLNVFPLDGEAYAKFAPQLIAAGANIIGGCCGTTPQHIAEVRKTIDAM